MGEENRGSTEEETEDGLIVYCSICGKELPDPEFALNYANVVCDECNSRALNADGEKPWHGWPPGEEPEHEDGVIAMTPDSGENPVYIDGVKCWRRYRFGGHIARRDTFDCDSLIEFYDTHRKDDGVFQVYNSPNPPGVCTDRDRILVEKVDQDELETHVWGILSVETGEILARNTIAEQVFGPFEKFLERVKDRTGNEKDFRRSLTDPTRLLSFFYSFGSQMHKPRVRYLVPELDRPLSGQNAIVETGVLRALREHDVNQDVFELGFRSASNSIALCRDEQHSNTQMTLQEMSKDDEIGNQNDLTVTVRYRLPYRNKPGDLIDIGSQVACTVLREIVRATDGTDYTYVKSLPSVDLHGYSKQEEVLTIGVDASVIGDTDWDDLSEEPRKLRDLAVTFDDSFP